MDDRLRLRASSLRSFDVRSEKVVAEVGVEDEDRGKVRETPSPAALTGVSKSSKNGFFYKAHI